MSSNRVNKSYLYDKASVLLGLNPNDSKAQDVTFAMLYMDHYDEATPAGRKWLDKVANARADGKSWMDCGSL